MTAPTLANPAAARCVGMMGGRYFMQGGVVGLCEFSDGHVCTVDQLMAGDCACSDEKCTSCGTCHRTEASADSPLLPIVAIAAGAGLLWWLLRGKA